MEKEDCCTGRMKATDVLRQNAKRLRDKACGLEQLANTIDEIEKASLVASLDGGESHIPYIGVGSAAEVALWEMACGIRS